MMKRNKKWTVLASALALTALCVGGVFAANGDKEDPLVTLSYLEQTVIPSVVSQAEAKMTTRQAELQKNFEDQIELYKKEMSSMAGGGASHGSNYVLVTLTSGQTMRLDVGCEVMLRVGTATVKAGESPALIDISGGGTLENGASLTRNHLYMATMADRSITSTSDTVKLMVRGGYYIV